MIESEFFFNILKNNSFGPLVGVPCSILKPLINYAKNAESLEYIPVNNEGEAVAFASGAYLAGKTPVVLMQNSGLGNCVSPLTSLNYVFRIPLLLIITWRGEEGVPDEPQHELMGQITLDMLKLMRVENDYFPMHKDRVGDSINTALGSMGHNKLPYALVMQKGAVEKVASLPSDMRRFERGHLIQNDEAKTIGLKRMEAISLITESFGAQALFISTTGKISRELFTLHDRGNQFYVVGSMGCASSIGLGLARYQPGKKVVVLDGDGAALMRLEAWVSVGHYRPPNYIHVVLDNESYESTGGQETLSASVRFDEIAIGCGFASAVTVYSKEKLLVCIKNVSERPGPHLIHVKVAKGSPSDLGRPTLGPVQVKERFMDYIQSH